MEFTEFANIIYIRGYFKTKPEAMEKLFKGSVAEPGKVSVSKAAINGYLRGETISSLAITLINAGLSIDKMSSYIKSLYEKKHRGTPTYKERFGNQTYKDALYNQVKGKFVGITTDNMSEILATAFFTIIQDAANEKESEKASKSREVSVIVHDFTMTDNEKRALLNLCESINRTLKGIKQKAEAMDRRQYQLEEVSKDESQQRWKEYLECDLKALQKAINELYSESNKYCADLSKLLTNKQHLHPSCKAIYEIASQIGDEKYKITCPDSFRYSALTLVITNFQKNYERLKKDIANH